MCGFAPVRNDGLLVLAPDVAEGDGTDAAYELAALADAERRHFWFRARAQLIAWAINRYFPDANNLLDVGCGTGSVLAELHAASPHLTLTGTEILVSALRYARGRVPDIELLQLDAHQLPFDRHFDVVCAFDVLEHFDDDEPVLHEMAKSAREGGGLVLTVPQHPWLWSRADEFARHRRRYRRRDLIDRVQRAGFSIRRVTSFVTLLLPALLWSRVRERSRDEPFDPVAEFRIGPVTNAAATVLSDFEQLCIRAGISWPAGGTLLLVGVRS